MDERTIEGDIELIARLPLEERAGELDELVSRLEQELESTSPEIRESPRRP